MTGFIIAAVFFVLWRTECNKVKEAQRVVRIYKAAVERMEATLDEIAAMERIETEDVTIRTTAELMRHFGVDNESRKS